MTNTKYRFCRAIAKTTKQLCRRRATVGEPVRVACWQHMAKWRKERQEKKSK